MVGFPGPYSSMYGNYGQQSQYGGGFPQMPYMGQPQMGQTQSTDNTGQMCSMMMAIFQPILGLLTSVLTPQPGNSQGCDTLTGGSGNDTVEGGEGNDTVSGGKGNDIPITEDPNSNSGALSILNDYADQIPSKNGKITQKDLKKFAASGADVPEEVLTAAKNVSENTDLYNLLCLKSNSTPEKGFKTSVLSEDWEKDNLDIDELETFDETTDAVKFLKGHEADIAGLDGDKTNITIDELKDIATGKAKGSKFKDPELRAAALKVLSDKDVLSELDAQGETDPAKQEDEAFQANAFTEWYKANK